MLSQSFQAAVGVCLDGSDAEAEQGGDIGLAVIVEVPQGDDSPLLRRQRPQRGQQPAAQIDVAR